MRQFKTIANMILMKSFVEDEELIYITLLNNLHRP